MKTKNGLEIVGVFRGASFVVSYKGENYLMSNNGKLLDKLNDGEKGDFKITLNDKEIKIAKSVKAYLSEELEEYLELEHPIREYLKNN